MTIEAPEVKVVDGYRVACDGGEGALGHPRVWLSISPQVGFVECGYCDCKYVHRAHAKGAQEPASPPRS
ncbi:MAG: zinc-finger domain-containing protein [Rhodobacteraceae bacterium]|nr:zinc-finger domain-containing protein [Paracoccaceae bacterium]